ncbi:putative hydrolase (plasmid) [Selenomonas ruminantium subsp. lactilytica TAM6421]|uniref:Putative hydrolase n=1 Tax=Selenomonas ruminantium subsp. lactilytica (strain NBRC 103574 / TAM6421) TaxID=927704 RepID=I0GVS1_SELRL|nr:alpha/beta hydrolase [Selenomonas ruminantium]BAL84858.1 putative hydrolase [Selenomonas ruminantium subsp. lactilytica TAM6421]
MKCRVGKFLAAGILGFSLTLSSFTAWAAPAWTLPESGLKLDDAAKQAHVAAMMESLKHPKGKPAPYEAPDGWSYETYDAGNVTMEKLVNPAAGTDRIIFHLHGGGYILPQDNNHRQMTEKHGILANAREMYLVDYRIAPQHTYPAALEDAVAAYKDLLASGKDASRIIVTGDSAGGNLALALSLYLKENKLPQPAMLILISPWTTLETNLPSRKYNASKDLILGSNNPIMYGEVKNPSYGKAYKAKNPLLSPLNADLSSLPPMLIQVGSYELFFDEGIDLGKKASMQGVDVTMTVYPGMSHDFALLLPELQDSVDSFVEIRDFINWHMK